MSKLTERVKAAEAALEKLKAENEKKIAQAKARLQKIKAREAVAERRKERANDTRRKILLGAFLLAQMDRDGIGAASVTYEGARLSDFLTREDDRALFGLKPLTEQR